MSHSGLMARLQTCIRGGNLRGALETAVTLQRDNQLKPAERAWRAILQAWPGQPDAENGLAMLASAQGRHEEALDTLRSLNARLPANPGLWMNRGSVELTAGLTEAAVTSFERAVAIEPRYPDPWYSLCDAQLRLGRADAAVRACDGAMAAIGRDFHALAFKAHALRDAGRETESDALLDHDRYMHAHAFDLPFGFADIPAFNAACARFVSTHPTLRANVMSTEHGKHTGELLLPFGGPMEPLRATINGAVRAYLKELPDDPAHPMNRWRPREWKITSWGVVMFNQGHERAHIHPKGWLSGVFYVQLPDVVSDPARHPEGWLEFGRPTPELHVRSAPKLVHYPPRFGVMYLFPSYFYHGTVPFRSQQRRVCVAFDIEPIR